MGIMAVILFGVEALATTAASKWFPDMLYVTAANRVSFCAYTLSPTITVVCIVMMRWGAFAAIHAVAGGFAYCLAAGASVGQFAVYCVGNCFALIALVFFKTHGKQKVKDKLGLKLLFVFAAFVGTQLGRWLVGLFFGGGLSTLTDFFAADSVTLLFTVVVVLISGRIDGLFEDQKSYLIRTNDERRRERGSDYYG